MDAQLSPEDRFHRLEGEWLECRRLAELHRVEGWEAALGAMAAEHSVLRAAGRWLTGRDDFLGVIRRARDEVTHSAVLGWLLDPAGRHGLGSRLTTSLLARLGLSAAEDDPVVVRLEVTGETSRADLVVTSGGLKVVIENKVDAVEQPCQCCRLVADHPEAQRFVFLTPTGRRPTTACPGDKWHCIRWSAVADLLEAALRQSGPAAGRHIAEDYLTTLRRELP